MSALEKPSNSRVLDTVESFGAAALGVIAGVEKFESGLNVLGATAWGLLTAVVSKFVFRTIRNA